MGGGSRYFFNGLLERVNLLRNERVVWSVYFQKDPFTEDKCAVRLAVKL